VRGTKGADPDSRLGTGAMCHAPRATQGGPKQAGPNRRGPERGGRREIQQRGEKQKKNTRVCETSFRGWGSAPRLSLSLSHHSLALSLTLSLSQSFKMNPPPPKKAGWSLLFAHHPSSFPHLPPRSTEGVPRHHRPPTPPPRTPATHYHGGGLLISIGGVTGRQAGRRDVVCRPQQRGGRRGRVQAAHAPDGREGNRVAGGRGRRHRRCGGRGRKATRLTGREGDVHVAPADPARAPRAAAAAGAAAVPARAPRRRRVRVRVLQDLGHVPVEEVEELGDDPGLVIGDALKGVGREEEGG
jgi:hypothetical protein